VRPDSSRHTPDTDSNPTAVGFGTTRLLDTADLRQVHPVPRSERLELSAENFAGDAAGEYFSTTPAMSVCVPGMQPMTVGCRNFAGLKRRFSWAGNVHICNEPPAYEVSAADWLTLVEKLGLASHLEDAAS
jgi:hypothetical protein